MGSLHWWRGLEAERLRAERATEEYRRVLRGSGR